MEPNTILIGPKIMEEARRLIAEGRKKENHVCGYGLPESMSHDEAESDLLALISSSFSE